MTDVRARLAADRQPNEVAERRTRELRREDSDIPSLEHEWSRLVALFAWKHGLSPRERWLVEAAVEGKELQESADELGCALGTVRTYWARIYDKSGTRAKDDRHGPTSS
jgi:DNA-binding NarL/FixJ family response regulator